MNLPKTWQDWVISVGQLLFFFALLPSVFSVNKPHWTSSLMTGTILLVFTYTFWTLGLRWGSVTSALVGGTWLLLWGQMVFVF